MGPFLDLPQSQWCVSFDTALMHTIGASSSLWVVPGSHLHRTPCIHQQCTPQQPQGRRHTACKRAVDHTRCYSARTQVLLQALEPLAPKPVAPWWQSPYVAFGGVALLLWAVWGKLASSRSQAGHTGLDAAIQQPELVDDQQGSLDTQQVDAEQSLQGSQEHVPFSNQEWVTAQGLGRVVVVARRLVGLQGLQQQEAFYERLITSTQGPAPSGVLVAWRSCILLVIEGCNLQLMALLRRLLQTSAAEHGLLEPRVVSYVLDANSRLYNSWACLDIPARDMGVPDVMSDEQWLKGVHDVEAAVKATGSQLSAFSKSAFRQVARDPQLFLGAALPSSKVVLSLASTELGPDVDGFLDAYDNDWKQYALARQQLEQAGQTVDSLSYQPQWRMLHSVYEAVWEGSSSSSKRKQGREHTAGPLPARWHIYILNLSSEADVQHIPECLGYSLLYGLLAEALGTL